MRIAHISDLHIAAFDDVPLRRFANKRVTGLINLMTFRRNEYSLDIFERLVADLIDESFDHVVVTGDLSNLALESEFQAVFDRLKLLGGWRKVSVIPGNHDAYTRGAVATRRFESTFYPFMFRQFSDLDVDVYPYLKLFDGVAVVGVNTAIRTPPLASWGRVGSRQMGRLIEILSSDRVRSAFKIVLLHHHLHEREMPEQLLANLLDQNAFVNVIKGHSVDLVLHGHDHVAHQGVLSNGQHRTQVFGNGSSTRHDPDPARVARYNVYTVDDGQLRNVETKIYDLRKRKFIWKF